MNRAWIVKLLIDVRASYWFLPACMVVAAILFSAATVWIDSRLATEGWWQGNSLWFSRPEGARAVLATVAGSMMTVAGVTFSLTLLAVSHATGHFGPRLLDNFMRDRGNQLTLGTFVSTFIYSLFVLRTVQTGGSASNGDWEQPFVPQISLLVSMALSLCSIGVLIYFIHHVPESIRLSNVVSRVSRQLQAGIETLFPEMIAEPPPEDPGSNNQSPLPENFDEESKDILCERSGYLQTVDEEGILNLAVRHELVISLNHRPGDFCCPGDLLVRAWPSQKVDESIERSIRGLFALGNHRTINQNVLFAVDQLVEVAQRALSPGVNEPMTAMVSMDWLKLALMTIGQRQPAQVHRFDSDGSLRVFSRQIDFGSFCDRVVDQIRPSVVNSREATFHLMRALRDLRDRMEKTENIHIVDRHVARLLASVREAPGWISEDRSELQAIYDDQNRDPSAAQQHEGDDPPGR